MQLQARLSTVMIEKIRLMLLLSPHCVPEKEEKGAKSVKLDSAFSQAVNCCAMGKEKLEIQMFFSGQIATFAVVTFQFSFFLS